jgi:hypothetical protein
LTSLEARVEEYRQDPLPFESRSRDLAERGMDPMVELPDGSFKRLSELTDDEANAEFRVRLDLDESWEGLDVDEDDQA